MDKLLVGLIGLNVALLVWLMAKRVYGLYPAFTLMLVVWLPAQLLSALHSSYSWDGRAILLPFQLLATLEAARRAVEFNEPSIKLHTLVASCAFGASMALVVAINPIQFNIPAKYAVFSIARNALHAGFATLLFACVGIVWAQELWSVDMAHVKWEKVNATHALLLAVRFGVDTGVNLRPAKVDEGSIWQHQHAIAVWVHIAIAALVWANLRRLASRQSSS